VILTDSNVIIDARTEESRFHHWAENVIAEALASQGIVVNAIVLAELCVGQNDVNLIEAELRTKGVDIVDVPAAASPICVRAYSAYLNSRVRSGGGGAPRTPLPDFFIGAHAELMGWDLATRDGERFRLYFPRVHLIEP
jgi:predicted nucleic acid-binding protein